MCTQSPSPWERLSKNKPHKEGCSQSRQYLYSRRQQQAWVESEITMVPCFCFIMNNKMMPSNINTGSQNWLLDHPIISSFLLTVIVHEALQEQLSRRLWPLDFHITSLKVYQIRHVRLRTTFVNNVSSSSNKTNWKKNSRFQEIFINELYPSLVGSH